MSTPACPFVLVSVTLYASVYACVSRCAQTDRPPTDCGNATSWGWKWTTGRGQVCSVKHVWHMWRTLPYVMSVNHSVDNEWSIPCQNNCLPCPTQWWCHTSSDWLKMIPIQRSVFDCSFGDAGLFIRRVWAALNRQVIVLCHIWSVSSARADRCEPVLVRHYTRGFSVETKRNDNASCHCRHALTVMGALEARRHTIGRCQVALHGRPSSSFDCQRCRNATQVNKLRSSS